MHNNPTAGQQDLPQKEYGWQSTLSTASLSSRIKICLLPSIILEYSCINYFVLVFCVLYCFNILVPWRSGEVLPFPGLANS
jgi:hypothetical protein